MATSPRDGRRGIYVMHADGLNARKLTNNSPSSFVTVVHQAGVDEAVRLWREARTPIPQLVLGDFPALGGRSAAIRWMVLRLVVAHC